LPFAVGALRVRQLSKANEPEFVDHDGLANLLNCSVSTVHKLRKDKVIREPCRIGGLVRWHWPTVRERILAANSSGAALADDEFMDRLNGAC
jgi:hypothetical protein